jgi:hypothetical protein
MGYENFAAVLDRPKLDGSGDFLPGGLSDSEQDTIAAQETMLASSHLVAEPVREAVGRPAVTNPESVIVPASERCLTEVDHINAHRSRNGTRSNWARGEVRKNLITAVMEAAIPHAVSKTKQEFVASGERDIFGRPIGTYMWLGSTAVEVAESGFQFHSNIAARARVAEEVNEARHNDKTLRPGFAKVFISPRMTRADASLEEAKAEHLAEDDAIRISYLETKDNGDIKCKVLESILVRDIPIESWVEMLKDPDNLWGKSINISDTSSALSVMKTHYDLEISLDDLPEGVVTLVEAVLPYIEDADLKASVSDQLALLRGNQDVIEERASSIADRWLDFEQSLADSLHNKIATPEIVKFINQLQQEWSKKDILLFEEHTLPDGSIRMTRKLASRIERAKQNLLWTAAGVVSGNKRVLAQLDEVTATKIYDNEMSIQTKIRNGASVSDIAAMEAQNNRTIARQNVSVGGGCSGSNTGDFNEGGEGKRDGEKDPDDQSTWTLKKAKCRIKSCPYSKIETMVGPCGVCMGRCQKIYNAGGDPDESSATASTKKDFEQAA